MNFELSDADINKLIASDAYKKSTHPEHTRAQTTVRNWFVNRYTSKTKDVDATGRHIPSNSVSYQPWKDLGAVLLVGEGNLSFAMSLLKQHSSGISAMTATTHDNEKEISEETKSNADKLRRMGAIVLHNIDATYLENAFKDQKFDTIIFQFPNAGSRDPKHGHNPNHILIRKFLKSAAHILRPSGKVFISSVNTPHYEGAFQFDEAAEFAGFQEAQIYDFDPSDFPGYSHTNTNDDESALEKHKKFFTKVFRLK